MAFITSKPNFKSNRRTNYENQFKLPKKRPASTFNPKRKEAKDLQYTKSAVNYNAKVKTEQETKLKLNYLKTKQKEKEKNMNFFNEINPMDGSSRSYYLKKAYLPYEKRLLMKQTTRNTRVENQTEIIKSGYGEQSNGFLQSIDPAQCDVIFSLMPEATNPSLLLSRESLQLFVHKAVTTTRIKNASENTSEVTIRQVESRNGISSEMPWNSPIQAWRLGLQEEVISNLPRNATENLIGSTPYISNVFNKTYDVKQETRFEISPGKTHIHIAESYINKMLYSELLKFTNESLERITEYQLITAKGTPVINKEKLPVELVSTAETKLIVTCTIKIDYF